MKSFVFYLFFFLGFWVNAQMNETYNPYFYTSKSYSFYKDSLEITPQAKRRKLGIGLMAGYKRSYNARSQGVGLKNMFLIYSKNRKIIYPIVFGIETYELYEFVKPFVIAKPGFIMIKNLGEGWHRRTSVILPFNFESDIYGIILGKGFLFMPWGVGFYLGLDFYGQYLNIPGYELDVGFTLSGGIKL